MSIQPTEIGDAALPKFIAATELPVQVDFWATWCAPCRQMAPHFANAAQQLTAVRFIKVDSDAAPQAEDLLHRAVLDRVELAAESKLSLAQNLGQNNRDCKQRESAPRRTAMPP